MSETSSYQHKEVEAKWSKQWLEAGLYDCQINSNRGKFSIALPPPNVTGELHMGHALSGTIQDILIRYNRMAGKDVLWQIGTDHAGIGTQIVVEKDLKKQEHKRKEDIGREAFIERSKAWKEDYGNRILEQMKLLGFSPDYKRVRYTMDDHYADAVKQTFIRYFNDGLIYRGKRITNWCPKCLTSLSDLEIEQKACKKQLYDIEYKVKGEDKGLILSTTRPETMFGDTGIAINPSDERYTELVDKVKVNPGSVVALIPFTNVEIPVLLDEHVKTDFGSGAMKVTPAHDANDFDIGKRHDLERPVIMDEQAKMSVSDLVPEFCQGLDRYQARDLVVEKLQELGQMAQITEYDQAKDLHDRCATEIEPYLSDQWYVAMEKLAARALECNSSGRSKFIPERYTSLFKTWLENIQDWCISRQIWWGHRIPVYYFTDENGEQQYYAAQEPRDPSHKQDEDVLDTWFSSALWPFETLKSAQGSLGLTDWDKQVYQAFYPTTVLATAREIINLWVTRMIFSSEYFENCEPFSDILIHPVVQTPDGKRMSKSKGNAIDPLELIEKYGADASRMWYASVGVHGQQDVRFPGRKDKKEGWGSDQIEQYRKFANKLFNASRYVLMQLGEGFVPKPIAELDKSQADMADAWILDSFSKTLETVNKAYDEYDFSTVQKSIYEFLWFDFCDWYIELTKVNAQGSGLELRGQILFHILEQCLRLLHPIMPFITEDLWQHLREQLDFSNIDSDILAADLDDKYQASIAFAKYPEPRPELKDQADSAKQINFVIQVISTLRNIRQSLGISWSSQFELLVQTESEFELKALKAAEEYVLKIAKLDAIKYQVTDLPKPASVNLLGESKLIVGLEGLVDLDKLRSNIEKKIEKLDKDILVLEKRLGSDNFVQNAAPEKVEETKSQLEDISKQKSLFEQELTAIT
ncbi:MAG: valine--tRNA ligase [Candidatus Melainabacteria bacterium]|nr:valine--tRNA ligase [Candidatus Melainabacteria bacterium]